MKSIFIQGLGQKSSSWNQTLSYLPENVQVERPDLVEMLKGKEVSYEILYQEFTKFCDSMTEPLNLCGLSLGGILALNYAIDYPDKVNSLILIGAQYEMPKWLLKIQNLVFRTMPKKVFQSMGFEKTEIIQLTQSMTELNFRDKIKEITCPTLIVCGEKDAANKKAAKGFIKSIVNSECHFVANAGHEVNKDEPQKLAQLIKTFYKKNNLN